MIVNRYTVTVKQGCMQEVVELVKEMRKQAGFNGRLYQSHLGTRDQIAFEYEFEDYAAYDKFWTDWYALPDTPAFLEKCNAMTIAGGTNELWWLIEQIATKLILHAGVAGIYAVATLPEFRRKGIGTTLKHKPLLEARQMRYRDITLQASNMGFSVYRQLGFQQICEIGTYLWEG